MIEDLLAIGVSVLVFYIFYLKKDSKEASFYLP